MERIYTFEELISNISSYNPDEEKRVIKAYQLAESHHRGVTRKSGAPYISHPIAVAYFLSLRKCDGDTICAALLHDLIEDTDVTYEQIVMEFGQTIANLVDGVTNLKKIDFSSDDACELANIRKIMESIRKDPRIIIIKLSDRLHNMETLEYKERENQIKKAKQTLEVFVPLAHHIGANWLARRLEDLCFKYLNPTKYNDYQEYKDNYQNNNQIIINETKNQIASKLAVKGIYGNLYISYKNIFSLYKDKRFKLQKSNINNVSDMVTIKIVVNDQDDCYKIPKIIDSLYRIRRESIKDTIRKPKDNLYQSLDFSLTRLDIPIQICIRTKEGHLLSEFGLPSYWEEHKGLARQYMTEDLNNKFKFYRLLDSIIDKDYTDKQFVRKLKKKIFKEVGVSDVLS